MLPRTHVRAAPALLLFVALPGLPAAAQSPSPAPPEAPRQDELDLQANANFVQGSGARAFGMGGAFLARADDATAASWNPAGLSYLRTPEFSFVLLDADFEGRKLDQGVQDPRPPTEIARPFQRSTRDDRSSRFPDFMAFTFPWEAGQYGGAVQVSYQRLIPFASSRTITDTTTFLDTNQVLVDARSVESSGGFDVLALGTGVRLSRKLRLGTTLNRWFNGYEQTRLRPDIFVPSRQESELRLEGWSVHVGAIVSPWENLNLGVVFKTGFTANAVLERVRYDQFDDGENTRFNIYSRDDVRLTLPGALGLGASWRPRSNITLSADYTRTNWSTGEIRSFFTLARAASFGNPVDSPQPDPPASGDFCGVYGPNDQAPLPGVSVCPPVLPYPTLGAEQKDTEQVRAGVEYVVIKSRLKVPLRAGFFRDSQFFPSLGGDAPIFDGFTVGTGLILNNVLFDVAYVYESGQYSDTSGVQNDVKFQKFYASIIYRLSRRP